MGDKWVMINDDKWGDLMSYQWVSSFFGFTDILIIVCRTNDGNDRHTNVFFAQSQQQDGFLSIPQFILLSLVLPQSFRNTPDAQVAARSRGQRQCGEP